MISHDEVGLESGKIMGRSCAAAMARIAASGMVPRRPESPRMSCGFSASMAAAMSIPSGSSACA